MSSRTEASGRQNRNARRRDNEVGGGGARGRGGGSATVEEVQTRRGTTNASPLRGWSLAGRSGPRSSSIGSTPRAAFPLCAMAAAVCQW